MTWKEAPDIPLGPEIHSLFIMHTYTQDGRHIQCIGKMLCHLNSNGQCSWVVTKLRCSCIPLCVVLFWTRKADQPDKSWNVEDTREYDVSASVKWNPKKTLLYPISSPMLLVLSLLLWPQQRQNNNFLCADSTYTVVNGITHTTNVGSKKPPQHSWFCTQTDVNTW